MKQFMILLVVSFLAFSAQANTKQADPEEVIKKQFTAAFPNATHVKWHKFEDAFQVYFKDQGKTYRIYFDESGNMERTLATYEGDELPPMLKNKIQKKYAGKEIVGVTELTTTDLHTYQIVLQDSKTLYKVNCDDNGNMRLHSKLKRS